ncbi:MAG: DUF3857 domain-containing protein [Pseudomonadota bacterium]
MFQRFDLLRICAGICLTLFSAADILAQQVDDYVRITPRPNWVVPVSVPDYDLSARSGRDAIFALTDFQNRHHLRTDDYSTRYVVDLLTPAAVEDQGTISLDFDPADERLELHHIQIVRDNRTIDAIDLTEAMLFRTETDRDQMIFNGTLTFSMPILDLRVGDRIDIAYTVYGRNSAIGTGFVSRRVFGTTGDIIRRYMRVMVADTQPVFTQTHNDPPEPDRKAIDGWTVFEWDVPDPQAPNYDTDTPEWAFRAPTYEISNFANWSDVGALFSGYYDVTDADRRAVADIVAEIASEHSDPKAQTRAALDWVQTNIRYVALALGEGGFIPRRPERVLLRRFGDCKDVTLLLLSLLDGLGVVADPILVDLDERGGEFKGLANPYAFNHIKVVAEIDGTLYPLDATRDTQLGTLDMMERGDIAFGLRLADQGASITRLPANDYPFREQVTERFDSMSDADVVIYTLMFEEYGGYADATAGWLASDGEDSVSDSFVQYLNNIFPTLELIAPMTVTVEPERAYTALSFKFRMPLSEDSETVTINSRAWQLLSRVPEFEGGTRKLPFSLSHPRDVRHIREYAVSDSSSFEAQARTIENEAFRFTLRDTVEDGLFREDYRWTSKQDFIAADQFVDTMSDVDRVRDLSFSEITLALDRDAAASSGVTQTQPANRGGVIFGWLVIILFPVGAALLIWRSRERRGEAPKT